MAQIDNPLLESEGLTKNYGPVRGVGPIDLVLEPGIHGLLGPNGSGKTTFLKTLLGFLAPTAGTARVLGHDIRRDAMKVRRSIGYMAENDVILPGLNATQSVRMAAELSGITPARAHEAASEALHAVGLGDERFHAQQRLSTGQRQKVKLAAALVHAPSLLVMDEPTNGLDPRARRTMLELIREVAHEKDISVILSTHILPDVESVCRDAVVLRDGRLVAVEPVGGRVARETAKGGRWYGVEVLGPIDGFIAACKRSRLEVEERRGGLQVAAPDAARVIEVARRADVVLSKVVPLSSGVEDAVLAHMGVEA